MQLARISLLQFIIRCSLIPGKDLSVRSESFQNHSLVILLLYLYHKHLGSANHTNRMTELSVSQFVNLFIDVLAILKKNPSITTNYHNSISFRSLSRPRSDDVRDPVQHGSSELLSRKVWRSGDRFTVRRGQHGNNDPHGHACPGETRRGCGVCSLPALIRSTSSA